MMRTTLTLDDDVARRLERLRRARSMSLKESVNDLLRAGLDAGESPPKHARVVLPRIDLGGSRIGGVDDVAAALAAAEGESFR